MPIETITLAVTPENCTVLGYRVKATDPMWRGLDLARATVRTAGLVENDLHLRTPYSDPEDKPYLWEGCHYRVRPKMRAGGRWQNRRVKDVRIVKSVAGEWLIEVDLPARRAA